MVLVICVPGPDVGAGAGTPTVDKHIDEPGAICCRVGICLGLESGPVTATGTGPGTASPRERFAAPAGASSSSLSRVAADTDTDSEPVSTDRDLS